MYAQETEKDLNFSRNVVGISFEIVGFLFMLIGSSGKLKNKKEKNTNDEKPRVTAIFYPNIWSLGILLIIYGLALQLYALGWD